MNWSSGELTLTNTRKIEYIKILSYLSKQFELQVKSKIYSDIKSYFDELDQRKFILSNLTFDYRNVSDKIEKIKNDIKKDILLSNLKEDNYYYKLNDLHGFKESHSLVLIDKVTAKYVVARSLLIRNIEYVLDRKISKDLFNDVKPMKIKIDDIFDTLKNHTLFESENFENVYTDIKFEYAINFVKRHKKLNLKDIKVLCKKLKECGFISQDVPDNNTLSYISKWQHRILMPK